MNQTVVEGILLIAVNFFLLSALNESTAHTVIDAGVAGSSPPSFGNGSKYRTGHQKNALENSVQILNTIF